MTGPPVEIDGTMGEGGGQIVRSALTLSLITGRPLRIRNIRAGRRRPGLLAQHLTAVELAARIGAAAVDGAVIGSTDVTFRPVGLSGGHLSSAVGTAGSTTLVLQTVLPALLHAPEPSVVIVSGGTHNPMAPPFDFFDRVFLPLLRRMGARVHAHLDRTGFYPAGGGRIRVDVDPVTGWRPLELLTRGPLRRRRAIARVARLPRTIAERELATVRQALGWTDDELDVVTVTDTDTDGPGNVVTLEIESEHVTELFTAVGQRGVRAEEVAARAADAAKRYLDAGVPVGPHLADQLLIPLCSAGGGCFRTVAPTAHCHTNAEVIRAFLDVPITFTEEAPDRWRIDIGPGRRESA